LVFSEDSNLTFTEVSEMDLDTLAEANAAYDIYIAEKKKAMKKK
jgi:hypothetical protein